MLDGILNLDSDGEEERPRNMVSTAQFMSYKTNSQLRSVEDCTACAVYHDPKRASRRKRIPHSSDDESATWASVILHNYVSLLGQSVVQP